MKIAIIGGGLAGCALAYVLKQAGQEPALYEAGASLSSGASGNSVGLYNPRFSALRAAESDYYAAAFSMALRVFPHLSNIDWNPRGTLDLITDERREKRFSQTLQNWGWGEDHMRLVSAEDASALAGIELHYDALHLPHSGSVSPQKLCAAYAKDIDIHLNAPVENLDDIDADIKILTCGPAVRKFAPDLPLSVVRGQLSEVKASAHSAKLKCAVCYGGYMSPALDGVHIVGSTFQRDAEYSEAQDVDDVENLEKLAAFIPGLEQGLEVVGHRASVRVTSRDYFPVVGQLADGLYVSTAHGSHGILSSIMAAHLLSDMVLGRPRCLSADVIAALSPDRFS